MKIRLNILPTVRNDDYPWGQALGKTWMPSSGQKWTTSLSVFLFVLAIEFSEYIHRDSAAYIKTKKKDVQMFRKK